MLRLSRAVACWMAGLGLMAVVVGVSGAVHWATLAAGTRTYYGLSLAVGVVLLASGGWVLRGQPVPRAAVWAGIAAALLLAVNQGAGMWRGAIPCFSEG